MNVKDKAKSSLAYIPGTAHCHLFNPGDESVNEFEQRYGCAKSIGSVYKEYPTDRLEIAGYWFVAFHRLVIRDLVDPVALHQALLQIPAFHDVLKKDWGFD
jgi:uncharacterized protein (DUF2236 family)